MTNPITHRAKAFAATVALIFLVAASAVANEYTSGHTGLGVWDAQAQANLPQWIKIWLMTMASVFALGLLFVWKHVEARWVVGGFVAALAFSKFGLPALGLIPLSGLVALIHLVFWSPALFLLLKNRPFMQDWSAYKVWSALATACILFSFIFDIRDAAIYLAHLAGLV